ncbi:MAG: SRPBCC domain-containing protein [Myxococcota bacterium]
MKRSQTLEVDSSPAEGPVIVMRRTFDAPREVVWAALTDPRHVAEWYGGRGFTSPVCEMDVRPGGRWRHVMRTPEGHEFAMTFIFLEVVAPEKLAWESAEHTGGPHDNVTTVTLETVGDQTKWTLVTRFRSFADREAARKIGFAEILAEGTDKVDEILRRIS